MERYKPTNNGLIRNREGYVVGKVRLQQAPPNFTEVVRRVIPDGIEQQFIHRRNSRRITSSGK